MNDTRVLMVFLSTAQSNCNKELNLTVATTLTVSFVLCGKKADTQVVFTKGKTG